MSQPHRLLYQPHLQLLLNPPATAHPPQCLVSFTAEHCMLFSSSAYKSPFLRKANILLVFFHVQLKYLLFGEVSSPSSALLFVWSLSSCLDRSSSRLGLCLCHLCVLVPSKSVCSMKQDFNDCWMTDTKSRNFLRAELLFNICLPTRLFTPFRQGTFLFFSTLFPVAWHMIGAQ